MFHRIIPWLFLVGCGGESFTLPPLTVAPAMYLASGSLAPIQDGQVVDLDPDLPPSMGFGLWVAAAATSITQADVKLTSRLKLGEQVLVEQSKTVTFGPSPENSSVFIPTPLNITTALFLPACLANVENQELVLEVQIAEPGGRTGVGTHGVVPACRRTNGREQIRCHQACSR